MIKSHLGGGMAMHVLARVGNPPSLSPTTNGLIIIGVLALIGVFSALLIRLQDRFSSAKAHNSSFGNWLLISMAALYFFGAGLLGPPHDFIQPLPAWGPYVAVASAAALAIALIRMRAIRRAHPNEKNPSIFILVIAWVMPLLFACDPLIYRSTGMSVFSGSFYRHFAFIILIIVIALFGVLFLLVRQRPSNRMARKVQAGDYPGALQIGEAVPPQKRDIAVDLNLASVYTKLGRFEDAKKAIASARAQPTSPPEQSAVVEKFITELERQMASPDAGGNDSP